MSDEENTVIFISSAVQKEDLLKKATEELAEEVRKSCDLFIYLFFFTEMAVKFREQITNVIINTSSNLFI